MSSQKSKTRKNPGRPRSLEGGKQTTVWLGKQHRRILAEVQRLDLLHQDRVSQGDLIRRAIDLLGRERGVTES